MHFFGIASDRYLMAQW